MAAVRAPELAKATNLIVSEAGDIRSALYGPTSPLQSELLHPGTYLLLVRTEDFAASAERFTIRPGEDRELEVRLAPGVRQRFEFAAAAAGAGLPEFVGFELRRDGSLVTLSHVRGAGSDVAAVEVRLAPGDYVLRTRELEPATEIAFRVEANEGAPLRVLLR